MVLGWGVLKAHLSDNQKEVMEINMHMVMINVKEKSEDQYCSGSDLPLRPSSSHLTWPSMEVGLATFMLPYGSILDFSSGGFLGVIAGQVLMPFFWPATSKQTASLFSCV